MSKADLVDVASRGDADAVLKCLSEGADINGKRTDGLTALLAAAEKGQSNVIQLLLEKGAHVNARDKFGRRAVNLAFDNHHHEAVALLSNRPRGSPVNQVVAEHPTSTTYASPPTITKCIVCGRDVRAKGECETFSLDLYALIGNRFATYSQGFAMQYRVAGDISLFTPVGKMVAGRSYCRSHDANTLFELTDAQDTHSGWSGKRLKPITQLITRSPEFKHSINIAKYRLNISDVWFKIGVEQSLGPVRLQTRYALLPAIVAKNLLFIVDDAEQFPRHVTTIDCFDGRCWYIASDIVGYDVSGETTTFSSLYPFAPPTPSTPPNVSFENDRNASSDIMNHPTRICPYLENQPQSEDQYGWPSSALSSEYFRSESGGVHWERTNDVAQVLRASRRGRVLLLTARCEADERTERETSKKMCDDILPKIATDVRDKDFIVFWGGMGILNYGWNLWRSTLRKYLQEVGIESAGWVVFENERIIASSAINERWFLGLLPAIPDEVNQYVQAARSAIAQCA